MLLEAKSTAVGGVVLLLVSLVTGAAFLRVHPREVGTRTVVLLLKTVLVAVTVKLFSACCVVIFAAVVKVGSSVVSVGLYLLRTANRENTEMVNITKTWI